MEGCLGWWVVQGVILRTGCCLRAGAWALPLMRPSLSPFLLSPAPSPLSFNFCSLCKTPAGQRELAHIIPIGLSPWVKVISEPVAEPPMGQLSPVQSALTPPLWVGARQGGSCHPGLPLSLRSCVRAHGRTADLRRNLLKPHWFASFPPSLRWLCPSVMTLLTPLCQCCPG